MDTNTISDTDVDGIESFFTCYNLLFVEAELAGICLLRESVEDTNWLE